MFFYFGTRIINSLYAGQYPSNKIGNAQLTLFVEVLDILNFIFLSSIFRPRDAYPENFFSKNYGSSQKDQADPFVGN